MTDWTHKWKSDEDNAISGHDDMYEAMFRAGYDRLVKFREMHIKPGFEDPFPLPSIVTFLTALPKHGYESFMYKPGDIVEGSVNGESFKYGVVKAYTYYASVSMWNVVVKVRGREYRIHPDLLKKADIPEELKDAVLGEFKDKCPIMREGCK